jgi:hypothetical protein
MYNGDNVPDEGTMGAYGEDCFKTAHQHSLEEQNEENMEP